MQVVMTSWGRTSRRFASSATVMNSAARMSFAASAAVSPPSSSRWWCRRRWPWSRLASVLRTLSATSFSSTVFFFLRSRRRNPCGWERPAVEGAPGRDGAPGRGRRPPEAPERGGLAGYAPDRGGRRGIRAGTRRSRGIRAGRGGVAGYAPGRGGLAGYAPGRGGLAGYAAGPRRSGRGRRAGVPGRAAEPADPRGAGAAAAAARARSSRARCTSCSCWRCNSSLTAVFSFPISSRTCWTVSGTSVLMWFFSSTPSRRTICSTASLDMSRSRATS